MDDLEPLLQRVGRVFSARLGGGPQVLAWGPGRINVIGEHTDYTGGLAMPAAIDRWVVAALRRRGDGAIRAWSEDFGQWLECPAGVVPGGGSWRRFAAGCTSVLLERYPGEDLGWEGVILGNVPLGAGLSSSAAVEVALLAGLRTLCDLDLDDLALARLGQRVEHVHLGVHSGLLDQVASLLSRAGQLMVVDFRDLRVRYAVADLEAWAWVVVDSGVRRELAASAYGERVRQCAEGLAAVAASHPEVQHYRDLQEDHLSGSQVGALRLRHVVGENQRVRDTERALGAGDLEEVGRLLVRSHASLRDVFEVSAPELDALVDLASTWPGCAGGRLVGGGFGGCTLHLVRREQLPGFTEDLVRRYLERTGRTGRAWTVRLVAGGGARPTGR